MASATSSGMSKTFKSERAAKMAVTKATNAWEEARNNARGARWALRHNEDNSPRSNWMDEEEANVERLEKEADRLWTVAAELYNAATKQGLYVHSYHFGHNPTRDLIAANID